MIERTGDYFWMLDLDLALIASQLAAASATVAGNPTALALSIRQPTAELRGAIVADLSALPALSMAELMATIRPAVRELGLGDYHAMVDFGSGTVTVPIELAENSASRRTIRYSTTTLEPA